MSKKKFVFPKQLLRQINECSNGGFVLFRLNNEGIPEIFSNFDDYPSAMALNYYISNWAKAIEAYNIEKTIESISRNENKDKDSSDKDDEDP
jgi:hypothetical protein